MIWVPPRSTRTYTLFPDPTPFRSPTILTPWRCGRPQGWIKSDEKTGISGIFMRGAALRPPHRIVFANEKGGTGKSTTAVHVAVALAYRGARVVAIDLDPRQDRKSTRLNSSH